MYHARRSEHIDFLSVFLQETFYTHQSLLKLIVCCTISSAQITSTSSTKCATGNYRDLLLKEQLFGKLFIAHLSGKPLPDPPQLNAGGAAQPQLPAHGSAAPARALALVTDHTAAGEVFRLAAVDQTARSVSVYAIGPTGKATSFTLERYFFKTRAAASMGFATPGSRDFHAFVSQPILSGRERNSMDGE